MALQHRAARCALTATRATRRGYATDTPASIFKNPPRTRLVFRTRSTAPCETGAGDMRVFGTGTLAALVSRASLAKFLAAHHHFYAELETRLDDAARGSDPTPSGALWRRFSAELRRAPSLADDVSVLLDDSVSEHAPTPAVAAYVGGIARAAERESSSPDAPPLLIAHFYVRYFADLFGASMPGWPTKRALGLPRVPEFYRHDDAIVSDRRATYVESVYEAINEVGSGLSGEATDEVAEEATRASALNAAVFRENGGDSSVAAAAGGARALWGYAKERVWGPVNRGISSGGWWRGGIRRRGSSRDGEDLSFARSSVARLANRIRARCCRHAGVSFALGFADRENSSPPVIQSAALVFGGR